MHPFFCVQLRNEITGSVMQFFIPILVSLLGLVCLSIYTFGHFVLCVSYVFCFPSIFSTPVFFKIFLLSTVVITDPDSACQTCDTKTRFWGFASCIASMCLFCSFSSPLPQYDSR